MADWLSYKANLRAVAEFCGHFHPMDRLLRHPLHYTAEIKRAKTARGSGKMPW
jgi:hypothetical protein